MKRSVGTVGMCDVRQPVSEHCLFVFVLIRLNVGGDFCQRKDDFSVFLFKLVAHILKFLVGAQVGLLLCLRKVGAGATDS